MRFHLREFLVVVAIAPCILYLFVSPSRGGRGFFSPSTLETKTQSEYLIWGAPIYRSRFEFRHDDITAYLIAKGYWSPQTTGSDRWIPTFHWNEQWRDGESSLERELFWRDEFWINWSNENPKVAVEFWPRVLELLRDERLECEYQAVNLLHEAAFDE
jgi:hypothetical protein